jgi:hypothetical protein
MEAYQLQNVFYILKPRSQTHSSPPGLLVMLRWLALLACWGLAPATGAAEGAVELNALGTALAWQGPSSGRPFTRFAPTLCFSPLLFASATRLSPTLILPLLHAAISLPRLTPVSALCLCYVVSASFHSFSACSTSTSQTWYVTDWLLRIHTDFLYSYSFSASLYWPYTVVTIFLH